jgi:hypothetical protein
MLLNLETDVKRHEKALSKASENVMLSLMRARTQQLEMLVLMRGAENQKQMFQGSTFDPVVLNKAMGALLTCAAKASDRAKHDPEYSAFQQELLSCAVRLLPVVRLRLRHAVSTAPKREKASLTQLLDGARYAWLSLVAEQRHEMCGASSKRGTAASTGVHGCGSLMAMQLNMLECGLRSCRDPFLKLKQGKTGFKVIYGLVMTIATKGLDKNLTQGLWAIMGHAVGKLTQDYADKLYAPLETLQLAGVLVRVCLGRDKPQLPGPD